MCITTNLNVWAHPVIHFFAWQCLHSPSSSLHPWSTARLASLPISASVTIISIALWFCFSRCGTPFTFLNLYIHGLSSAELEALTACRVGQSKMFSRTIYILWLHSTFYFLWLHSKQHFFSSANLSSMHFVTSHTNFHFWLFCEVLNSDFSPL